MIRHLQGNMLTGQLAIASFYTFWFRGSQRKFADLYWFPIRPRWEAEKSKAQRYTKNLTYHVFRTSPLTHKTNYVVDTERGWLLAVQLIFSKILWVILKKFWKGTPKYGAETVSSCHSHVQGFLRLQPGCLFYAKKLLAAEPFDCWEACMSLTWKLRLALACDFTGKLCEKRFSLQALNWFQ